MKFFEELKRRNVIKETLTYLVVSWVLIQVGSVVLPIVNAPDWVLKTEMFFLAVGLPIWIFFSWAYQVTPTGIKKTSTVSNEDLNNLISNKKWNVIIVIMLVIAIAVSFVNKPTGTLAVSKSLSDHSIDKSMAVLSFLDMSPEKDQEYLSDGVAEEIHSLLCKFENLKLAGLTSSFSFKNKNEDLRAIGKQLGVSNILEGSVKKMNEKIIVSVRLTDAETGFTHLTESYTDDLQNIYILQSKIAQDIAAKIKLELSLNEKQYLIKKTIDPLAFDFFLKGKSTFVNGPVNSILGELVTSKKYFIEAIKKDSTFAEAHAYLALVYFNFADWAIPRNQKSKIGVALDSAKILSRKAISLDSLSSGAHLAMGSLYVHEYNWIQAEIIKRKAVLLNKGGSEEKVILASFLGQFSQAEEALSLTREAISLDPLEKKHQFSYARDLFRARKFDECIQHTQNILVEQPNSSAAYQFLWLSYWGKGQLKEAAISLVHYYQLSGREDVANLFKSSDFDTAVQKMLSLEPKLSFLESPMIAAFYYATIKDKENTLKNLELALAKKESTITYVCQVQFDFLREDPKFLEIYEKAGFKAYNDFKGF